MNKFEKFNKYEKIFFRIHLAIFALGLFLLSLVYLAQNAIETVGITLTLYYVIILNFFISIVRLIKYLIVFRNSEDNVTIRRTVSIIFTSPIALGIYFIITLVMSLSLVSCS